MSTRKKRTSPPEGGGGGHLVIPGVPNTRQKEFFSSECRFTAYGGARGGGKSWALRRKLVGLCLVYPGIHCLLIRRSYPELKGKSFEQIRKMNLKKGLGQELSAILFKIKAHELYFSSFSEEVKPSALVRKHYGSENTFVYEMKNAALMTEGGYLYAFSDSRGVPRFRCTERLDGRIFTDRPKLLVDLFEHAYFADYGFNYSLYLDGALSHIDLSVLDK